MFGGDLAGFERIASWTNDIVSSSSTPGARVTAILNSRLVASSISMSSRAATVRLIGPSLHRIRTPTTWEDCDVRSGFGIVDVDAAAEVAALHQLDPVFA